MSESSERVSIGKIARKGIRRSFDEISTVAIVQILLRLAALAPMLLSKMLGGKLPDELAIAGCVVIYIFAVIPMRFWARQKMRRVYYSRSAHSRKKNVYSTWLKTGLLRYLRGILWGLPFLACMGYFTIARKILDVHTFNIPIHWLIERLNGKATLAYLIIAGVLLLFALLFAYGWWRDLPFEYLPVRSIGTKKTLHWSRRILKKHRGEMRKNTFVNALLSIPAWVGFAAVLALYAMKSVNFSLNIELVLRQLLKLLNEKVPQVVLLELLAVFAVLYLPLCVYRKSRNAALMGRLIRSKEHSSSGSEHTHEEETAKDNTAVLEAKRQKIAKWEENLAAQEQKAREEKEAPAPEEKEAPAEKDEKADEKTDEKALEKQKEQEAFEEKRRQFEEEKERYEALRKQFEQEQEKHDAFQQDQK